MGHLEHHTGYNSPFSYQLNEALDIAKAARRVATENKAQLQGGVANSILYGTWVASETVDANLSQVQLPGDGAPVARGVRKLAHVTGLVVGSQVMMLKSGNTPLTIIGVVVGDVTKLEVN